MTLADRTDSFRRYWEMDEPKFGEPKANIPKPQLKTSSRYWEIVLKHAQANPGEWIPLINSPMKASRMQQIAWAMRQVPQKSVNIPGPVRGTKLQIRYYRGTLWFYWPLDGEDVTPDLPKMR